MSGVKLCGAIGKELYSAEVSHVLEAATRALKLTSQPTPLIYLIFVPASEFHSSSEFLHFAYPKLGIDFVLKPKWDYKYPRMKGEGLGGEVSLKEEDYDLRKLEVDTLSVYNGRDGDDTQISLGGNPNQVIWFATFPCEIREWYAFDDLMGHALFFTINSTTRLEKFERKLGEPDTDYLETERTKKEEEVYELTWSQRSPGLEIEFGRQGGERVNDFSDVGGKDRWMKYTLINS